MLVFPKYYSYFQRVWLQINTTALVYILLGVPSVLIFVNNYKVLIISISILPMIIFLLIVSLILHKHYLVSININETEKDITLKTVLFDKVSENIIISFEELDVSITQVQWSFDTWYKIQFYKNRKLVFQQREFKEWDKDTFDKIAAKVKELKSKKI